MDGASKFVRNDAVAGIIITLINLVGGIIIGTVQNDMSFAEAMSTYSNLTVGDGLVSQVPALVISIAAGLIISKSGNDNSTGDMLFGQLTSSNKAIGLTSAILGLFSILPGTPFFPFITLSTLMGLLVYKIKQQNNNKNKLADLATDEKIAQQAKQATEQEDLSTALKMDALRVEFSYDLIKLITNKDQFANNIKNVRKNIVENMGFITPKTRIKDNINLANNMYHVYVNDILHSTGIIYSDKSMVLDPETSPIKLAGEKTTDPTFGLPAMWVNESVAETARQQGLVVVDALSVITTHVTEIIKDNMAELLTYEITKGLIDSLSEEYQKLISDISPNHINLSGIQKVLQQLLDEKISIRNLPVIIESIAEICGTTKNINRITEHVRLKLSRQITSNYEEEDGSFNIITLSPEWENEFISAMVQDENNDYQLNMSSQNITNFMQAINKISNQLNQLDVSYVLLVNNVLRPHIRNIIRRFNPSLGVMSQNEVYSKAKINNLGQVS